MGRALSRKEYVAKMNRIKRDNKIIEMENELQKEKNKYRKLKLPSTSKLMAAYLFLILNIVLAYAMIVMYVFRDLSCLSVLITDVVAQVLTYMIYSVKALKENTSDSGFVYEVKMAELNNNVENQNGNVG